MALEKLCEFILDHQIIGFFDEPITLKSGRTSHFYVNWRQATSDAFLLDQLTDFIVDFISTQGLPWDCIYGVPEGATKTAVLTGFKLAKRSQDLRKGSHVIPMGRAKPKSHGNPEDRFFIGMPQGKTIVLEDTTTTGLSLIACIKSLQQAGVEVTTALSITDRMEKRDDGMSVEQAIQAECGPNICYMAMTRATDLIAQAANRMKTSEKVRQSLTEEFQQYGVAPLSWSEKG